ncbi:hypothetical protein BDR06DRAFT_976409 [Suillus hirtellus]|nr:hypothetical protein BDR06DRAFT_976409 [Suillus hirtellus]
MPMWEIFFDLDQFVIALPMPSSCAITVVTGAFQVFPGLDSVYPMILLITTHLVADPYVVLKEGQIYFCSSELIAYPESRIQMNIMTNSVLESYKTTSDVQQLRKFQSNPTISTITHLQMPTLEVLIQEAGVTLGTEGYTTKKKIIEALMTKHTHNFLLNKEAQIEIDDNAFIAEELVEECVTKAEAKNNQNSVSTEVLADKEINSI